MESIKLLAKGAAIGIANIIPGVSGGTMALLLGLYERLIAAIHSISHKTVFTFLSIITLNKQSLSKAQIEWKRIDGTFLLLLLAGAGTAIIAFANLMKYLLKSWHDPTYGFFFGLVLISVYEPFRRIRKKSPALIIIFIIGIATVLLLDYSMSKDTLIKGAELKQSLKTIGSTTTEAPPHALAILKESAYFIFLGSISISAMILPGISGAFLLLLLGGYFDILQALSDKNIILVGSFLLGCLAGIILFSRLLYLLLNKYHDSTMGYLTGLVIGSLWVIWPFKNIALAGNEIIYLSNTLPKSLNINLLFTTGTTIIGMIIVSVLIIIAKRQE